MGPTPRPCSGLTPGIFESTIKASFIMKGKGDQSYFSLKNFFHIKIDPFAKQVLSQEAPPPISLDGGVRCWDGHTTAHTPNEMHQSSGEGIGEGAQLQGGGGGRAGTEGPGRQGHKAWQRAGGGPHTVAMP